MTAASPPLAPQATMSSENWIRLGVLSLLWGGAFIFTGVAVAEIPPVTVSFLRLAIAATGLWIYIALRGLSPAPLLRAWPVFVVMGFLNTAFPFTLISIGQTEVPAGLASVLNATTPICTALVAGLALSDERLTVLKFAAVLIGFSGVAVILSPGLRADAAADWPLWAPLLILCATLSYAVALAYTRLSGGAKLRPTLAAAGLSTFGALWVAPVALIIDQPWTLDAPSLTGGAAMALLGLLSTAVAFVLFFRILSTAGAVNMSLVTFLIPVWAVLMGVAFLGEQFLWETAAGMALIALGLSLIDGRLWRRRRRAAAAPNPR